jgi:hypothetical protein
MLLNADYIEPVELTGYVRDFVADLPDNQFQLARWLPRRQIDDLEYRFTRGGEGLIEAATFRAYDAESPIGNRPGLTRVSGELPPISRKIRLGEYDRLRARSANAATIRDSILSDAERMSRAVEARLELARGDALVNGSVTISENGVVATISFGRSGSHTVAPGVLWSTIATATVLADLLSWQQTYITSNGEAPGSMVMSTTVLTYMLRNAEIRALVGSTLGAPSRVSQEQLRGILDDHGLPPWYIVDEQINVNGTPTRPIPIDKFLFLPAPVDPNDENGTQLGATLHGTTAESLEADYGLTDSERPGIVAGAYRTDDPIAIWTKAAAIAVPVEANPNLSFMADVA